MINLPETVTVTLYLMLGKDVDNKPCVRVHDFDLSQYNPDMVLLGTVDQQFDVPKVDLRQQKLESLCRDREQARTEMQIKNDRIDSQIKELMEANRHENR